ncbi:hypothetical protein BJV77DRAFT_958859 [Russula vinacea]|nr:hypothetical protein BJV77DRAFT_958859 [Russula vinacea]
MPGSSHICGLMACRYSRVFDQNKPRSLTFDAHIVIGFDDNNDTRTCCAVLHHFRAAWEPEPIDNAIYEVAGKIASIPPDYNVGINHKVNAYDFIIDAEKMALLAQDVPYPAEFPTVEIAGFVRHFFPVEAGARRSERECVFDINNYVAGEQRVAGHICHLPSSNPRFAGSKIPLPGPAKASSVVGHILHSIPASDEIPIKRLFVEAYDVAFLSADNPSILPSKKISSSGPVRYSWAPPIALTVDKGKRKASDINDDSAPKAGPSTRRKRD